MEANIIKNTILLGGCITPFGSGALADEAILSDLTVVDQPYSYPVIYEGDSTTNSFYTATSLFEKAIDDLDELSELPVGWDSYGSDKISSDLIIAAKIFLDQLEYEFIDAPRVVPISGGGIQFEWEMNERELELEFIDPDNIACLKVLNDEPIEESQFNINDFNASRSVIQWLKGF